MKTNRIVSMILTLAVLLTMAFPISVAAEDVELFDEGSYVEDVVTGGQPAEEVLYVEGEEPAAEPAAPAETESENELEDEVTELEDASLTDSETEIFEAGAPAVIVAQPENAYGNVGDTVTFTVEADNAKSYVWQYSKDKGNTWTSWKADEYKQATLTLNLTSGRMSMKYRCAITGQNGKVIYSDAVGVSDAAAAKITQQPENASGSVGDTVTFVVEADNAKSCVWQYSKDKGKTWTSWKSDEYKQPILTLSLTSSRMSMKYRCAITGQDGKVVYSNAVGVTAGAAAVITQQPVDVTGSVGDTVSFTVKADNAKSCVWQYSKDKGKTWTSWVSDEYKQATLTLKLTSSRMSMKYRCAITGQDGKVIYSDAVGVTAGAAAVITKQPVNAFGSVGDTVSFTVKANNAKSYVWQYSKDKGKTWTSWKADEYKKATLKLSLTSSRMSMKYRCAITGQDGKVIYSDAVGVDNVLEYNGLLFKLNADGTLTVTGYTGNAANVVVPETVKGFTVTVIGESAFENMTFIVSVKLPSTITVIMRRAFAGCTSLREMS